MNRDNADGLFDYKYDRSQYIETSVTVRDWLPTGLALVILISTPNWYGLIVAVTVGVACALVLA